MNEQGIRETAVELEALLPCPFCGGADICHEPLDYQNGSWVMCESCGASTDSKDSNAAAIATWNRRAAPPIAPGEREAFEQYGRENWLMCGLDFDRRPDGTYTSHETHIMWCCYRSGVRAAKAQAPVATDKIFMSDVRMVDLSTDLKEHDSLRAVYEAARLVIQSHCHPVTVAELSKAIEAVKDIDAGT